MTSVKHAVKTEGMALPIFNLRLPKETVKALRPIAKAYNGGNLSGMIRDMLVATTEGPDAVAVFTQRFVSKLTGQLMFDYMEARKNVLQDTPRPRDPVAGTRKRGEGRGRSAAKKRGRRARTP